MGIPIKSLPQNVQDKITRMNQEEAIKKELTKQAESMAGVIRLTFNFKAISKDNEKLMGRNKRFFLSKKFKDFDQAVALEARRQYQGQPLTGDLEVTLVCNFVSQVHADCGNLSKGIYDSLQNVVYKNDRQIKKSTTVVNEGMPADNFHVIVEFKKGE